MAGRRWWHGGALAASGLLALVAAGCGGGGDEPATTAATPEQEAAYIAAIRPTFGAGEELDEERWIFNGRILCRTSDRALARIRTEDLAGNEVRAVRTMAAVTHLCPARLPVVRNPERYLTATAP